jgi:hypothetical protein
MGCCDGRKSKAVKRTFNEQGAWEGMNAKPCYLRLCIALFAGSVLPTDLSKFGKLKRLYLSTYKLGGTLPEKLPPNLMTLDLSFNKDIGGSLPGEWSVANKLRVVDLRGDWGLTGRIPNSWATPGAFPNAIL